MRALLADILGFTTLFDTLKITGTADSTLIEAVDKDQILFFRMRLAEPVADLEGVFAIPNLDLLSKTLAHPPYKAEGASFSVQRAVRDGLDTIEQMKFMDATGFGFSVHRCASGKAIPQQAVIPNFSWDVVCPADAAKVVELEQVSKLYAGVDKLVGTSVKEGHLLFSFGENSSSTHRGGMVFATDVAGALASETLWNCEHFLKVIKLASKRPTTIRIAAEKTLNVEVQAELGTVDYFLRPMKR